MKKRVALCFALLCFASSVSAEEKLPESKPKIGIPPSGVLKPATGYTELAKALQQHDSKKVRRLLADGANPNQPIQDESPQSILPLQTALASCDLTNAITLLEYGAVIDKTGEIDSAIARARKYLEDAQKYESQRKPIDSQGRLVIACRKAAITLLEEYKN